ncbi:MAG: hypothetical protein C0432_02610 [Candidatus Puniceispirillum sp.]|nr:hypothetical protein [Candidatus Pelagibacter sp.]MBA4283167.1 hypothetical protein [Candidatus Puniceispirillum sp.]
MPYKAIRFLYVFLLFVNFAQANAGVPMLGAIWPPAIISLLFVILIESRYMQKSEILKQHKIEKREIVQMVRFSNIISTLFGMPFVWFVLMKIQMVLPGGGHGHDWGNWEYIYGVTVQAAWLIPFEQQLYWMIPVAYTVLMVPCFLASYWIELHVNYGFVKSKIELKDLKKIVWNANLCSYAFLMLFPIGYFFYFGVWIKYLGMK